MKNLYHKVAVASVCTALGFVLGASEEVKAATITLAHTTSFEVWDLDDQYGLDSPGSFDGLGDLVPSGGFGIVYGTFGTVYSSPKYITGGYEIGSFAEFNIGNFSAVPNTFINSAIFQAEIYHMPLWEFSNPGSLGIFGYVGNGTFDASDFEAGVFLSSVDVSSSSSGDILNFDVTPFVNQRVSNGDAFAGFGIRVMNDGFLHLGGGYLPGIQPRLIVETADVAEPVPEPTTIFGSAIGLCLGGWLKRKKSSQQNKTTPQR